MGPYNHSLSLDATLWSHKTAQSLVNTLLSFLYHNRLPWRQCYLLETPLITALGACNSKTARGNPFYIINF